MISNIYAKAYTEVLKIIKYFPEKEYSKIPTEKIEFYKHNMDKNYNFIINPEIDLSKQNISPETNAILVNLFIDYFASEEQKIKIKNILDLNQEIEEQEKRKTYNPNNLFKKSTNIQEDTSVEIPEKNTNTALIEYKESFFTRFKHFIFKILHKK